ncbi:MAG TPA: DUF1559 domain-containing protein [Pirellulaceae bacterium]|nr:DUF1559 domain-containing protein [Pirellulaceae bacterium]
MNKAHGFTWKVGCGVAAVALLVVACFAPVIPVEFVFLLVFGWIGYLLRVVPEVEWDLHGILTGLLALTVFTVGLHAFLAWLSRAHPIKTTDSPDTCAGKSWPFVRTVQIVLMTLCLFVAGISMVGVTHQVAWLAEYPGPWVEGGRQIVRRMVSGNNLQQFGVGAHSYHDMAQSLPAGMLVDEHGLPSHGWMTLLLPHLDQPRLAEKVKLDKPWNDPVNREAFEAHLPFTTIDSPRTPKKDADGYALSHYAGSVDLLGSSRAWKLQEVTDGMSQTVLIGEAAGNYKAWGYPRNVRDLRLGINQSTAGFGGPWDNNGGQFTFADGSVHFIHPNIDPKVLKALATPNANDEVGEY